METKVKTWGGRREGSGRKRDNPEAKKVQMVITIAENTRDKMKAIAESQGIRVGHLIDKLIEPL